MSRFRVVFVLALSLLLPSAVFAQSTAFTYQGYLEDGGAPAEGAFDLRFILYDAESGGSQVGDINTLEDVSVIDGVFAVELDFGNAFGRALRYLEVALRDGGSTGAYTVLSPREPLRPAPSALTALSLPNVTVDGSGNVGIGTESPSSPLTVAGRIESTTGGIRFPDGTTQTTAGVGSGSAWQLGGNAGTAPSSDYLGTSDATALELRVDTRRVFRLEPATRSSDGAFVPNVIGGHPSNAVGSTVYGATISGGGLDDGVNPAPNGVSASYGTVGGGYDNTVSGSRGVVAGGAGNTAGINSVVGGGVQNEADISSTIAGGQKNVATAFRSTVGGGDTNQATSEGATVGGGFNNQATGEYATVGGGYTGTAGQAATVSGGFNNTASGTFASTGGGEDNRATASYATIAGGNDNRATRLNATVGGGVNNRAFGGSSVVSGGQNNVASGDVSTVAGGTDTEARGAYGFAAGVYARVKEAHAGSWVWADASTIGPSPDSLVTTGPNQFLVRALGGVGVGTNAPVTQMHVAATRSGSGAVVDNHVALIENTGTSSGPDVLALKVGRTGSPGGNENFVTFFNGDDQAVGAIDGNGSGGVTFRTSGADYAEWLPHRRASASIRPHDLVAVRGGRVDLHTGDADRLLIVTDRPAILGNAHDDVQENGAAGSPVAFIGQVPVRVRGPVHVGDLLVASGRHDGTARAVAPAAWRPDVHGPIAGQAWTSASGRGPDAVGVVTAAVGLGDTGALVEQLQHQQRRIDALEAQVQRLEALHDRLARLEARDN